MKLADESVLFIDCQTTGATPGSAHLLELGWSFSHVSASSPAVITRLVRLPADQELPLRIQRITGITPSDMEQAHHAADVVAHLVAQIDELKSKNIKFAVAHYSQFEKSFVTQLFLDHSLELPFTFICTCQIAKRLYPDLPSRAIRALGGYFGLSLSEMKRSACHVEATFFIWQRLVRDLALMGIEDGDQLVEWLSKPVSGSTVKNKIKNAYAIPMERLKRLDLPDSPGIYRMLNAEGKILYIGKATSLKSRVNSYFRGRKGKDSKTKELISQIFDVAVQVVATPLESALLETDLIKEHDPPYNRALRERGRYLTFYNHDFSQSSCLQEGQFKYGPFVSEQFKPLLDLLAALQSRQYPQELFWGLASEEIIASAFDLFIGTSPLSQYSLSEYSARRFLAFGMTLLRQEINALRALRREQERLLQQTLAAGVLAADTQTDGGDSDSAQVPSESEIEEEAREIDENDVLEMIYGILIRCAKMHLQAKKLSLLLNAGIGFSEGKRKRMLIFACGKLVHAQDLIKSDNANYDGISPGTYRVVQGFSNQSPWSGLEIDTYDRMRVLMTELARVGKGNKVEIFQSKEKLCSLQLV